MYLYFASFEDDCGAPSFSKFARHSGICREDIETYREHEEFNRAYNECIEIRRDYLVDKALTKRFDSSVVKFLLSFESNDTIGEEETNGVDFTLHVVKD